jgi:hypothetical protein
MPRREMWVSSDEFLNFNRYGAQGDAWEADGKHRSLVSS